MKKRRFKTLADLRRYLAHVLNEYESGQADETKVKTVAYAVNILSGIVKDSDLETRVDKLEKKTARDMTEDELMNIINGG